MIVTNVVKSYNDQNQTWSKHLQDDCEQTFYRGEDVE